MMELKPGSRWRSAVCDAEVVLVRAPKAPASLECGGHPMTPFGADRPAGLTISGGPGEGVQVGKRYVDDEAGVEVLCSKAGAGSLSLDGRPLKRKEAKALTSSD
jgi:hypothetical protein